MSEHVATAKIRKPVEEQLKYQKEVKKTSDGDSYLALTTDKYKIALFPTKQKQADPSKKSRIKYNARVTLRDSGISFQTVVKELTAGDNAGQLLAGQKSRLAGHRAVISDWDGENSYERMSVPNEVYQEMMAIIEDAVAAE